MRRLVGLGAALVISLTMASAAGAQGLADVRLGNEAFRQGDFAAAVEHYTAAIRSGELVGEALAITYNNRGVAHGEAGDFGPAIADYSQALALRPEDATTIRNLRVAHVRRGEVSLASGAYEAAEADFSRAIELEPDHHLAYQRRGELFAERGLVEDALADLEQAAMLNPGDPEIVAALDAVRDREREVAGIATTGLPEAEEPMPADEGEAVTSPPADGLPPEQAPPATAPTATAATEADADAAPEASSVIAARPEPAPRTDSRSPEAPEPAAAPSVAAETTAPETAAAAETPPEPAATAASAGTADPESGEPYRTISAVNYRAGPANDAPRLGTVDAGRIVRVTGDTLGWKHVTLPNGDRGYIYGSWLEPAGN